MSYEKNQQSIIRQSSLKMVSDYCKIIGTPLTLKELVGVTNVIVDYCENGYSKELGDRLDRVDIAIRAKFDESL